jgi:hypothetical protein
MSADGLVVQDDFKRRLRVTGEVGRRVMPLAQLRQASSADLRMTTGFGMVGGPGIGVKRLRRNGLPSLKARVEVACKRTELSLHSE